VISDYSTHGDRLSRKIKNYKGKLEIFSHEGYAEISGNCKGVLQYPPHFYKEKTSLTWLNKQ
jgi:hypothetical protein